MVVQLNLKATANRDYVSAERREVLALVGLETEGRNYGESAAQAAGFELAVAIDCSGSMNSSDRAGREKLGEAIKGLFAIIDRLQPNDVFSVIGFDGRTRVVLDRLRGGQKDHLDRGQLDQQLRAFGGMTNIHAALELSRSTLGSTDNAFVQRIILLSDGDITTGPGEADCYRLAQVYSQEGIVLDALGYGYSDLRWDFLTSLAGPSSGKTDVIIESPDAILAEIFSRAKNTAASKVKLSLQFAPNVLVGEYYRCEPSIMYMGRPPVSATHRSIYIQAGQVEMGKDYAWIFELEAPAGMPPGPIPLANVGLEYQLPDGSHQTTASQLVVQMTDDPQLASQVRMRYKVLHEEAKLNKLEVELGKAQKTKDRGRIEGLLRRMIQYCDSVGLITKANLYRQQLAQSQAGGDLNELAIEISKSTTQSSTSAAALQDERGRRRPPARQAPRHPRPRRR